MPASGCGIETGLLDFGAKADMRHQLVLAHAMIDVIENLGLRSPFARPVGLELEGEAVGQRRGVARRPRVGIVAPRSADAILFLEDGERANPGAGQEHGEAEAREPRADDGDTRCRVSSLTGHDVPREPISKIGR